MYKRMWAFSCPLQTYNVNMRNYFALGTFLYFCCVSPAQGGGYDALRHQMVEEVLADVAAEVSYSGGSALSPSVVAAMQKVERHLFVPASQTMYAYHNRPLPIGYGQTISQPLIVAMMTDLMQVKDSDKVPVRATRRLFWRK